MATPAAAQSLIVPDQSLPGESSEVIENVDGFPVELITGGAMRDRNLFHSFSEFNVDPGRVAFFIVPGSDAIANIFARVTGANPSNIDGVLGAGLLGGALTDTNLFLINPNGIVFGEGARLNLGGSFIATTANGLQFGSLGEFSAVNPTAPSALLTINPSAFLFNQADPGAITSRAPLLSVFPGQSLLLVGGPIALSRAPSVPGRGLLLASGGEIDLVAVAEPGQIAFSFAGNRPQNPQVPAGLGRADISLQSVGVETAASTGGTINLVGRNLSVADSSFLITGVFGGTTENPQSSGDITLDATDAIAIERNTAVFNLVAAGAVGRSGDIKITADNLTLSGGSQFGTVLLGSGQAGDVSVNVANRAILSGTNPNTALETKIRSTVEPGGQGSGGTIAINAGTLEVTGGAVIDASTFGSGSAGTVKVNAEQTILAGVSPNRLSPSGIRNRVEFGGQGQGGNIELKTGSLLVTQGAQVSTTTLGKGNAGNVIVTAGTATLADSTFRIANGRVVDIPTGISSSVAPRAEGNAGSITLTADVLAVTEGAQLVSGSFGKGDAGNLTITARDSATFTGISPTGQIFSGAGSRVELTGQGQGGSVEVNAGTLLVTQGAQITASTLGQGNAGDVLIQAREATFSNSVTSPSSIFVSGAQSNVLPGAQGKGGTVKVAADTLQVTGGAQLASGTFSKGDAGNVVIQAGDITISGVSLTTGFPSGVFSTVEPGGAGNGGNVSITGNTLRVSGSGQVSASTAARGNGGDVAIAVSKAVFSDSVAGFTPTGARSSVFKEAVGDAGNLLLSVDSLELLGGAQFSTGVFGTGRAGTTTVVAKDAIVIDGEGPTGLPSGIFSTLEANTIGSGGDIRISAGSLTLTRGALIDTSTFSQGSAGDVVIDLRDTLRLDGFDPGGARTAIFSVAETNAVGDSGDIRITTGSLFATNGAQINAFTAGQGNAGDVIIEARDRIVFDGRGPRSLSGVLSTVEPTGTGSGGDIKISTGSLDLRNGGLLAASSEGAGDAGNIVVQARGALTAANGDIRTSALTTSGGAIAISARSIRLFGDSDIRTNVDQGRQDGGSITLQAGAILAFNDSDILAFARDGRGGDVTFRTAAFFGQNYQPQLSAVDPATLDGNNRVDINASGAIAGIISVPDVSFVPNSLTELPASLVAPDQLLAGSCIAPAAAQNPLSQGTFVVTGSEGLPQQPGESAPSTFPTGAVATAARPSPATTLVEPQAVYALADGRLVLSRECGS